MGRSPNEYKGTARFSVNSPKQPTPVQSTIIYNRTKMRVFAAFLFVCTVLALMLGQAQACTPADPALTPEQQCTQDGGNFDPDPDNDATTDDWACNPA